jgi:hypothetical protein
MRTPCPDAASYSDSVPAVGRAVPSAFHRLEIDARLDGHAPRRRNGELPQPHLRKRPARGELQLNAHQVESGYGLGHRVFDLQARIRLDEGEWQCAAGILINQELNRSQAAIVHSLAQRHGELQEFRAHVGSQAKRRRDLDELLTLTLHAAFAVP